MQSGRLYNKQITTIDGTGLTNSGSHGFKHVEIASIPTATSNNLEYQGEDDSQKVITGAGGDYQHGSSENAPARWGYVSPSGSRIEVNDSGGSEKIDIVHKSGAGISMDTDGAVFIHSQSPRGSGLSAPFGDIYMSAGGDIVIKGGSSLTVQTSGDFNLDVGGTMAINAKAFKLITELYNAIVDGSYGLSITNDASTVVGGNNRQLLEIVANKFLGKRSTILQETIHLVLMVQARPMSRAITR